MARYSDAELARVCAWCGFRFGQHHAETDFCPIPPATPDGRKTWDSRTFKAPPTPPQADYDPAGSLL